MVLARTTLLALAMVVRTAAHTYLPPRAGATGPAAALVWIQGALIPSKDYTPLLQVVQNASELSLWIGQPSFLGDTPEPARLAADIAVTLKLMRKAGLNSSTPVYFGAHSLGTVFLQQYCAGSSMALVETARAEANQPCAGQILVGGPIARTNFLPSFSYPVPTLTVGGSLDGLARVTRTVAESYYHQVSKAAQGRDFPVVVIEGMNHYQWGSGAPSALEKQRDLAAELSLADAHTTAAALLTDWLSQLAATGGGDVIAAAVAHTGTFVAPIVAAYELEGSRHFNAPAQIGGPLAKSCVKGGCPQPGSAWAARAQGVIAGDLDGWSLEASNQFVDCQSTNETGGQFHLPTISPMAANRTVRITTFAQCNWATGDVEDTAFVYTSASEIAAKLASKQCLLIEGVGTPAADAPFNTTDAPDFCMEANQLAYATALSLTGAASRTALRYAARGQPFLFGPDISKPGGPLFLDAGVKYKDEGDAGVRVSSPMMKTEKDYWKDHFHVPRPSFIPDPGCYHYCKLLSPARAIEWIYVDGLRRNMSLPPSPKH